MGQAEWSRRHYEKNKSNRLEDNRLRKKSVTERVAAYKINAGCKVCGYNKCGSALDFHHLNPKGERMSVAQQIRGGWSFDRIMGDIQDQIVVCKNCHAEIHSR
jgi:hypothetical protein